MSNLVVYIKSIRENLSIQITEKGVCTVFLYIQIKRSCGSIFGIFVYTKNKNLGRVSDLKINLVRSARSFPDFFYLNILAKKSSLSVYIFGFFLIIVILSSFSARYLFKVLLEIPKTLDTSS